MFQMRSITDRAEFYRSAQFRSYELAAFEFRDDDPKAFTFEGVASVVDKPYVVRDMFGEFTETIRAGAFNKTLRDSKADVALFVNHRHADVPLASTLGGPPARLGLAADPDLRATATLNPDRPDVQIARHAVLDGVLREMSIGFTVNKNRDQWNDDYTERVITEVNLFEVSIVRQGANPLTSAAMRSVDDLLAQLVDVEMTEDELRRAIAAFEARLPEPTIDEIVDTFAERDRLDRERLERKRLLRPVALV